MRSSASFSFASAGGWLVRANFASAGFFPTLRASSGSVLPTIPPLPACCWEVWSCPLLLVAGTGIALDQTKSLDLVAEARTVPVQRGDFHPHGARMTRGTVMQSADREEDDENEGWLQEFHEFSANLMLLFVGIHVSYMILLRRPLARFMLFVPGQKRRIA
jgi:hypothetical protein